MIQNIFREVKKSYHVIFIKATANPFAVPNNLFSTEFVIITLAAVKQEANAIRIDSINKTNTIQRNFLEKTIT